MRSSGDHGIPALLYDAAPVYGTAIAGGSLYPYEITGFLQRYQCCCTESVVLFGNGFYHQRGCRFVRRDGQDTVLVNQSTAALLSGNAPVYITTVIILSSHGSREGAG